MTIENKTRKSALPPLQISRKTNNHVFLKDGDSVALLPSNRTWCSPEEWVAAQAETVEIDRKNKRGRVNNESYNYIRLNRKRYFRHCRYLLKTVIREKLNFGGKRKGRVLTRIPKWNIKKRCKYK